MGQIQLRIALWHGTASALFPAHLLSGDFDKRLGDVRSALKQAREQWLDIQTGTLPMLKIFVGPEGLLAKSDTEYSLEYEEFKEQASGLKDLSEGLLFIPGTVIWKKPALKTSSGMSNRLDKLQGELGLYQQRGEVFSRNAYPSYSSHHKEGADRSGKVLKKLEKLRENWDGGQNVYIVRNVAYAYYNQLRVLKYYKQIEYKPNNSKKTGEVSPAEKNNENTKAIKFIPGYKDGAFDVPLDSDTKVRCGVEICADHYNGQLKNSNQGKNVHLHFILSDYVYNNDAAFSAQPGGYVIHASTVKSQSGLFLIKRPSTKENPSAEEKKPYEQLTPDLELEPPVGKLQCYAVTLDV